MLYIENTDLEKNYLIELVPRTNAKITINDEDGEMDANGRYKFCLGKRLEITITNSAGKKIYDESVDALVLENSTGQILKNMKEKSFKIIDHNDSQLYLLDRG